MLILKGNVIKKTNVRKIMTLKWAKKGEKKITGWLFSGALGIVKQPLPDSFYCSSLSCFTTLSKSYSTENGSGPQRYK